MHPGTTAAGTRRVSGSRRDALVSLVRTVLVTVTVVAAYFVLPLTRLGVGSGLRLAAGLALVAAVLTWHLREISRSAYPRMRAVEALALTFSLFAAVFSTAYYVLDRSTPGAFTEPLTRLDAAYLTLTIFATVGFGDIAATSQTARALTMVQMVADLVLVGVVARMLVNAVQVGLDRRPGGP